MKEVIHVLDWSGISGELLDGKGNAIPEPSHESAVWLPFTPEDCGAARNSRGELFSPNITLDDFMEHATTHRGENSGLSPDGQTRPPAHSPCQGRLSEAAGDCRRKASGNGIAGSTPAGATEGVA